MRMKLIKERRGENKRLKSKENKKQRKQLMKNLGLLMPKTKF